MKTMQKLLKAIIPITAILSMGLTTSFAEETGNLKLPEPIKVLDFSKSFDELATEDEGFEVIENEASPVLIEDSDMGQVLQLNKAIIKEQVYDEKNNLISDGSEYSTIKLSNPYVGLDYLKEYKNTYDEVETTEYQQLDSKGSFSKTVTQPLWKEGITISYWIKVPVDENGIGRNSNVVGFTNERFQMEPYDHDYYIRTVMYDIEYNSMTDEERALLGSYVERCGVLPESKFYFEYAEEELYEGKPLYKDPESDSMGEMFHMNKFYTPGYFKLADGTIKESKNVIYSDKEFYNFYHEAPRFGNTEEDHDPGNSNIRYGWTYGEMWLDATSSFYFTNDTERYKQLNPNHEESYNEYMGYNRVNTYNITSCTAYEYFSDAVENNNAAPSPASMPEEWHNVCVVIQNDWVQFYLDGEEIDIIENYGLNGNAYTLQGGGMLWWKMFNKGTGPRGGYNSNRDLSETYYGQYFRGYFATTIMEWLTMENTRMTIGGGDRYSKYYTWESDTDEIKLKNVVFYDKMLNAEQIEYLAENPFVYDSKIGDVNTDGVINANDALAVLKYAARLEDLQEYQKARGNVAGSEMLNAEDALEILKYAAGIVDGFEIK